MSAFFHAMMASYGLRLAQLHPNAVLGFSIFQYFCETFVGVHPSVALFRHYFYPRVETGDHVSGAVSFCRRANQSDQFIPTTRNKRWEEWRHQWVFVRFPLADDCLAEPVGASVRQPS